MKLINKLLISLGLTAAAAGALSAQNTTAGYFLDDYMYRFQMNPAMANSKGFVSMPGIGNLNIGFNGNLHLKNVLYNVNGRTTTFLHPEVSASEVLGNLKDMNNFNSNIKVNVLTAGFKGFGGYNTINIGVRADIGLHLPKSIFSLLKEGVSNNNYEIDGMRAFGNSYAEIALGHSHDLPVPGLRIGGAVKVLVGIANIDAQFNRASLNLGVDDWSILANADVRTRMKGFTYDTKRSEHTHNMYVNGANVDGAGVGGFGLAFDLGATYTLPFYNDVTVSVGLLDLGFIKWDNDMLASTNGDKTFNTDRYTFNADDDAPNSFKRTKDQIVDDISALYELENMGDQGGVTTPLGATLNIGAEYKFPLYRKLSFGLLNTTRIQKGFGWTNFRLSANVAPVKVFDASVSVAGGTYGFSFGWLANIHMPGFNLFVGMDHTTSKLAKQGVPLSSNAQVNFGLNFPF